MLDYSRRAIRGVASLSTLPYRNSHFTIVRGKIETVFQILDFGSVVNEV